MPPVVEPPPVRPLRQRRKATWAHRIAVTFVRLMILGVILGIGGGGYYLAKRGFGRQWRYRVVEELRKRGVEASIGRLTLDPFRGLIAKNVRIFDYKNRENILALISEVSLDINYAALIHHEPFLNALDVRCANHSSIQDSGRKRRQGPAHQLARPRLFSTGTNLRQPGGGKLLRDSDFCDRATD